MNIAILETGHPPERLGGRFPSYGAMVEALIGNCHAFTGFDLVSALGQTAAHARAFNESAGRPYAFWVGANLVEFFFGIGVCQAFLFAASCG